MNKKKRPNNEYLKYTGLGFEFLACILLFVGAGYGLDQWLETEQPWFLMSLSLAGCGIALYLLVRKFWKP